MMARVLDKKIHEYINVKVVQRLGLFVLFFVIIISGLGVAANVVINEVMYDPDQCSDFYCEWIELYNPTDKSINLTDWTLCDKKLLAGYINKSDGDTYSDNGMILSSQVYALITDGNTGTKVYNFFNVSNESLALHVDAGSICGGLNDEGGDFVYLNNSLGTTIDVLNYSDSWDGDGNNMTLEKINPLGNNSESNWNGSLVAGGTPGGRNSVTLDRTEPSISYNHNTQENNTNVSGTFLINVSASDMYTDVDTIEIYVNGTVNKTCASSPCELTVDSNDYADGSLKFNATANDTVDNTNTSLPTRTVTVDNTKPSISYETPTPYPNQNTTGNLTINISVADNLLDVNVISIFVDNNLVKNCTISANSGNCYYNNNSADGTYTYNATANDTVGNTNTSLPTRTVTVDNAPPNVVSINEPLNGANYSTQIISLNATVNDTTLDVDTVLFEISNDTSSFNITTTNLGDDYWNATQDSNTVMEGLNNVTVIANDTVGNENDTEYVTITIDRTEPSIAYNPNTQANNTNVSDTFLINVSTSDTYTDVDVIEIYVNGTVNKTCESSPCELTVNNTDYSDGLLNFTAVANDTVGNTNTSLPTRTVTVNNTQSTVPIKIIINEVMYDPIEEDRGEFVELYNYVNYSVNLSGWKLSDSGTDVEVLSGFNLSYPIIPAYGYAIITDEDTELNVPDNVTHLTTGDNSIGNGLSNSGEIIMLNDANGNSVDGVNYSKMEPCSDGRSLERANPKQNSSDVDTWNESYIENGTLGYRNSAYQEVSLLTTTTTTTISTSSTTITSTTTTTIPLRVHISLNGSLNDKNVSVREGMNIVDDAGLNISLSADGNTSVLIENVTKLNYSHVDKENYEEVLNGYEINISGNVSIMIVFEYNSTGIYEDSIAPYKFNNRWKKVENYTLDKKHDKINFSIRSASTPYIVVGNKTCTDGTQYGSCVIGDEPRYCDNNGNIINKCSICGCSSGKICREDGTCQVSEQSSGNGEGETEQDGCGEEWQCTAWSVCVNNKESRECQDINKCNTTFHKPLEQLPCGWNKTNRKRVDTVTGQVKLRVATTTTTTLPVKQAGVGITGGITGFVMSDSAVIGGIIITLVIILMLIYKITTYPKNF